MMVVVVTIVLSPSLYFSLLLFLLCNPFHLGALAQWNELTRLGSGNGADNNHSLDMDTIDSSHSQGGVSPPIQVHDFLEWVPQRSFAQRTSLRSYLGNVPLLPLIRGDYATGNPLATSAVATAEVVAGFGPAGNANNVVANVHVHLATPNTTTTSSAAYAPPVGHRDTTRPVVVFDGAIWQLQRRTLGISRVWHDLLRELVPRLLG